MQQQVNHFPKLSDFLACWFHQDTWLEFETDEQVWVAAFQGVDHAECHALLVEVETLLELGIEESHDYVQSHAESLYTDDPAVSAAWLKKLADWMKNR